MCAAACGGRIAPEVERDSQSVYDAGAPTSLPFCSPTVGPVASCDAAPVVGECPGGFRHCVARGLGMWRCCAYLDPDPRAPTLSCLIDPPPESTRCADAGSSDAAGGD